MNRFCKREVFAVAIVLFSAAVLGSAQQSNVDLKKEIEEIKRGQQTIRKELAEIKAILYKLTTPQNAPNEPEVNIKDVEFDIGDNPILGNDTAKLVMVEFVDYQCPYCSRYVRETFPQIMEQYIDKGILQYAVIDNPLGMHKMALKAAEASHCAKEQNKFWEIHKLMMTKQEALDDLNSFASVLNLGMQGFEDCLKKDKYKDQIGKESELSTKLGVLGVPGFIIASANPEIRSKMKGITFISGAQPLSVFNKAIDQALLSLVPRKPQSKK
jgi:protein-disulfide isomerase